MSQDNMDVFVCGPLSQFSIESFPLQSDVRDLVEHYLNGRGSQLADFYVKKNGRLSGLEEKLQAGAVYRLEPRLCGGKGGFGSMLRALGAQIEKTTNREACRDLSGRRLRDVNHEKEMAEWLKKQAERDAEKEQRRLERLQRKLAEPRHQFTDPQYEQQCHDLSERLEDSVLKGMQASSSGLVKVDEEPSRKRPTPNPAPKSGKRKRFWAGTGGLDDLGSSDDDGISCDDEDSPSTSASGSGAPGSPATPGGAAQTTGRASASLGGPQTGGAPAESERSASGPSSPESSAAEEQESAGEGMEGEGVGGGMERGGEAEEKEAVKGAEEKEETEAATGTREEERACVSLEETSVETSASLKRTECDPIQRLQPDGPIDLQALSCVDQLEALGLERLKAELTSRGMKCGGTLAERAARLFSTRGLSPEQIPPALLAKPSKGKKR